MILAAVIPGPDEPHLTINSYLDPIVSKLWNGIEIEGKIIHGALVAVGCDLPAARKIMGCQTRQKATCTSSAILFSGYISLYTYSVRHMHIAWSIYI